MEKSQFEISPKCANIVPHAELQTHTVNYKNEAVCLRISVYKGRKSKYGSSERAGHCLSFGPTFNLQTIFQVEKSQFEISPKCANIVPHAELQAHTVNYKNEAVCLRISVYEGRESKYGSSERAGHCLSFGPTFNLQTIFQVEKSQFEISPKCANIVPHAELQTHTVNYKNEAVCLRISVYKGRKSKYGSSERAGHCLCFGPTFNLQTIFQVEKSQFEISPKFANIVPHAELQAHTVNYKNEAVCLRISVYEGRKSKYGSSERAGHCLSFGPTFNLQTIFQVEKSQFEISPKFANIVPHAELQAHTVNYKNEAVCLRISVYEGRESKYGSSERAGHCLSFGPTFNLQTIFQVEKSQFEISPKCANIVPHAELQTHTVNYKNEAVCLRISAYKGRKSKYGSSERAGHCLSFGPTFNLQTIFQVEKSQFEISPKCANIVPHAELQAHTVNYKNEAVCLRISVYKGRKSKYGSSERAGHCLSFGPTFNLQTIFQVEKSQFEISPKWAYIVPHAELQTHTVNYKNEAVCLRISVYKGRKSKYGSSERAGHCLSFGPTFNLQTIFQVEKSQFEISPKCANIVPHAELQAHTVNYKNEAVCLRISVYKGRKSKYGSSERAGHCLSFGPTFNLQTIFKWRNRNLKFRRNVQILSRTQNYRRTLLTTKMRQCV